MQCSRYLRYFALLLTFLTAMPTLQAMQLFPLAAMDIVKAHTVFDTLRKHVVIQASSNYQLAKADPHYFTKLIENDNFRGALDTLHPEKRAALYAYFEALQHRIHANPANLSAVGHAYTTLFNYFETCTKDLQLRSYLLRQMERGQLSFNSIDAFNAYQKQYDQAQRNEKQARKAARMTPGKKRAPVVAKDNTHNEPELTATKATDPDNNHAYDQDLDENQGFWRGIFAWIMRNKIKAAVIGVGAGLTVYGVLAKIMSWWPFNENPVDQGQQPAAPAPAVPHI